MRCWYMINRSLQHYCSADSRCCLTWRNGKILYFTFIWTTCSHYLPDKRKMHEYRCNRNKRVCQAKSIHLRHHANISLIVLLFWAVGLTFSTALLQCLQLTEFTLIPYKYQKASSRNPLFWIELFQYQVGWNKGWEVFF